MSIVPDSDYKPFSVTIDHIRHRAQYEVKEGMVTSELRGDEGAAYASERLPEDHSAVALARNLLIRLLIDQ